METPPPYSPQTPPAIPQNNVQKRVKCPTMLIVLGILSLFGAFFSLITYTIVAFIPTSFVAEIFDKMIEQNNNPFISTNELQIMFDKYLAFLSYVPYILMLIIINTIGIIAILRKKVWGFWIYCFAQISILAIEAICGISGVFSYIFTAVFIALYYVGIRQLEKNME